jgi:AraC-like DNA-binding protein/ligand-binding sensor protein
MQATEFRIDQAERFAGAYAEATGVGCVVLDRTGKVLHPPPEAYPCRLCRLVADKPADADHGSAGHWRWVEQAARFGGRYIFLCENSFTHWTSPIMHDGRVVGALVAGPVLTIPDEDFFEQELLPRVEVRTTGRGKTEPLRELFDRVPRLPPARVTALSELLYATARTVSDSSAANLDVVEAELERQSRISEYVQELKHDRLQAGRDPEMPTYPLEREEALLDHIRVGDVAAAQKTLNELLGHVFFAAGSDVQSVRFRVRELVVLLSRAVLREGADPEEVFGINYRFVDAIEHQEDINGIAYWVARVTRRFADLVLYLPNVAHGTAMRRAASFVRERLAEPIRIGDVARHVGLSDTYFSRVFSQEMGMSFVRYVNAKRLERARALMRSSNATITEIAAMVGFSDHSYFTKLFRQETGMTPSAFRGSRS